MHCFPWHSDVFIHPHFLRDNGIPFSIAVQEPGDILVTGGHAAHQAWSTGPFLGVSYSHLDSGSVKMINERIITPESHAPWPCVCTPARSILEPVPVNAPPPFDRLYYHDLGAHVDHGLAGPERSSLIYRWIRGVAGNVGRTFADLTSSEDTFAKIWRFVYTSSQ